MKPRAVFCIFRLSACLALLCACTAEQPVWQGFQGTPAQGLRAYAAELRISDLRGGAELGSGALFVSHGNLRYEMQGSGPFGHMFLLARLDSGKAWLVNPAGNSYMEGSFTPQRWMNIGYLLEAFPGIMPPQIISQSEELLGQETLAGYKISKIRRTGREALLGEEKDFTELFWLAEEFCIPLRHEHDTVRTELANIRVNAIADALFMLPAECRKVSSFTELLQ